MKKLIYILVITLIKRNALLVGALKNQNLMGSMITAPNAGVVLLYKGQYAPAEHVIHNTAMFPMTANTCYLIPIGAARKIPACYNYTIKGRQKRLITDIISVTMSTVALTAATAALGTATASLILSKKLEEKTNELQTNMQAMSNRLNIGEARMTQFEENQIKFGTFLKNSQNLLNSTMAVVNGHSARLEVYDAQLRKHQQALQNLQQNFIQSEQDTSNRFLYLSIHDIYNGKQTLSFLHPADMNAVIAKICEENNITITETAEQLPVAELITRFILRQKIDFIPAENYSPNPGDEIGKLMFTTFYAMPNNKNTDFDIYQIFTGPFIHQHHIVRLGQMPTYVGINRKTNTTISWTNDDTSTCIFDIVTTCRETPAEISWEQGNGCLTQILSGTTLKNCRTEHAKVILPHIQQLYNGRWMISTNNTALHCIRTTTQTKQATKTSIWSENEEIIIPPVAIISVPNGTTVYCPGFNLPGPITPDVRSTINIIKNLSTAESMDEIIDLHQDLISNKTWEKLPYINDDLDKFIQEMLTQKTPTNNDRPISWQMEHIGKLLLVMVISILIFSIIIMVCIQRMKQPKNKETKIALQRIGD